MKLMVTGATGVIGAGVIPHLLRAGHDLRILSRGAEEDAREWPNRVEAFTADIGDGATLRGACDGCDAVVHIVGIARESPPSATFERINVDGTRNIVLEAERSGVARFIFMSSLGALRGTSAYHVSKRRAEEIVRAFKGSWVILRPGNVYGPGDEVISMVLGMVRVMPVIPVIGSGDQRFQPLWYDDLGAAVATVVERDELSRVTLDLAGEEVTTTRDILDRLSTLTGKTPPRISLPSSVASVGARIAEMLGIPLPISQQQVTMLDEENVLDAGSTNALVDLLGVPATTLAHGLAALVDLQPEQTPGDGVGSIERKVYWADIVDAREEAIGLMAAFKDRINDVMPIDFAAEPGAPTTLSQGATMTAKLPVRGTVQMRVEEMSPQHVTLATLRGHPIAGVVQFGASDRSDGVLRFEVVVYAQAASIADWVVMKTAGGIAQNANWNTVVERMVELSGGTSPAGVETEMETLSARDGTEAEDRIKEMVVDRKRDEHLKLGTE